MPSVGQAVTDAYGDYVVHCERERVPITETPADVFARLTAERLGWHFTDTAVSFALDAHQHLLHLDIPTSTVCAGIAQDIVWSSERPGVDTPFLAATDGTAVWHDQVDVAVGDTTTEALSALVRGQLPSPAGPGIQADYELLLDALQLGLLRALEPTGSSLITLEQELHARAFAKVDGGHEWTVQPAATDGADTTSALTLPIAVAEQLYELNVAQQAYDSGRDRVSLLRQQLFMDWIVFVKQLCGETTSPVIGINQLSTFLATSSGGELHAVTAAGAATGQAHYTLDPVTGHVTGVTTADGPATAAGRLVSAHDALAATLSSAGTGWRLDAIPAAPFWQPTDPVLVIEGDRMEPVRRNGPAGPIAVRCDRELIAGVALALGAGTVTVAPWTLPGMSPPPAALPFLDTAMAVIGEGALLDPQFALLIATASGAADPAAVGTAVIACQGGQSPLDSAAGGGVYATVHAPGYVPARNPAHTVTAPVALTATFTNPAALALAPDPVGWTAQALLPEFAAQRADPFLPVWMIWTANLDPLARASDGSYAPTRLTDGFALDADVTDLTYQPPAQFTTGRAIDYTGAVLLSKQPAAALAQQIDRYLAEYPTDPAHDELVRARDDLTGRKLISQGLDTFSLAQTLRTTIPQITVADLVRRPDPITGLVASAANATPGDSWYDTAFNALAPISAGPQAVYNFGPLRAGFVEITRLRILDVFGQVMDLATDGHTSSGALKTAASHALSPPAGDSANAEKVFLAPRVLWPCRVDGHWLSAAHDDAVGGDFVVSNDHPATSPVCGWVVPNHLELSLAFYDAGGAPIGSFGLEHGDRRYRTRAGNTANLTDALDLDIGTEQDPKVNIHVARLMRFIAGRPAAFLRDLMATIERAEQFINPASAAQDVALATLIGQPLAIARTVQALGTRGGALPVSQANTTSADALAQAVAHGWTAYGERQAHTSAGLGSVAIPTRLGDLTDIGDGLVAFLPEGQDPAPYQTVFSPAAPAAGANGVVRPAPDTVTLTFGGAAQTFTTLVDPRAPIHVTTGVLPTLAMAISPDQYLRAMQQLAVTFTTRPVLRDQLSLRLPLPVETGFAWSWIDPGHAPEPLAPATAPDVPIYGHGPLRLLEGWLSLQPAPPAHGDGGR
jgi:hypothetical protein